MNCKRIREMLDFFADGELGPFAAPRVKSHLGGCRECRQALSRVNASQRLLAGAPVEEPPSTLRAAILEAASRERGATPVRPPAQSRTLAWAAAATAVVCILAMSAVVRTLHRPEEVADLPGIAGTSKPASTAITPTQRPAQAARPTDVGVHASADSQAPTVRVRSGRAGAHRSAGTKGRRTPGAAGRSNKPVSTAAVETPGNVGEAGADSGPGRPEISDEGLTEIAREHDELSDLLQPRTPVEPGIGAVKTGAEDGPAKTASGVADRAERMRLEAASLEQLLAKREAALGTRATWTGGKREIRLAVIRGRF